MAADRCAAVSASRSGHNRKEGGSSASERSLHASTSHNHRGQHAQLKRNYCWQCTGDSTHHLLCDLPDFWTKVAKISTL